MFQANLPPQPCIKSDHGPAPYSLTYQPAWSDEFLGPSVDTTKWGGILWPGNNQYWDAAGCSISGGALQVKSEWLPVTTGGSTYNFHNGGLKCSEGPVLYGYFETRCKAALTWLLCPSLWMFAQAGAGGVYTDWHEIDVFECQQNDNTVPFNAPDKVDFTALIFADARLPTVSPTAPKFQQGHLYPGWLPNTDYHTYGVWWTPNFIRWFVDGRLAYEQPNNLYWDQPMDIALTQIVRPPLSVATTAPAGFPSSSQFQYVRVWQ